MPGYLRQATASQTRVLGPFIGTTDYESPATSLTINASDVKLSLAGGASTTKNSGGGTHVHNGEYSFTFDATDTATVGQLAVSIKVTGALIVRDVFQVLEENVYDAMIASSADLGTLLNSIDTRVGNLAVGSGGISVAASIFTKSSTEPETNDYTVTAAADLVYHIVEDVTGTTDGYYEFNIGPNGVPIEVEWLGYAQSNGDSYAVFFYNWSPAVDDWEQVGTIAGSNATTPTTKTFSATTSHVGTGANDGVVRLRFYSTDGTAIATDRILCTYTVLNAALGYEGGFVWVDETAGTSTGTTPGTDGLITNRSDDFDNAQTIAEALGYHRIGVTNGNSITLTTSITNFILGVPGSNWTLAFGGQAIANCDVNDANISGTYTGATPHLHNCTVGNVTGSPSNFYNCGFAGIFNANGAGDYRIVNPHSDVAGASSPTFNFAGTGGSTTANVRNHFGGGTWVFDSDCVASIEVTKGGGQTITTGGGDVELRGFCRSVTITTSGASITQCIVHTGPVTITSSGTATTNIYGFTGAITVNGSGGTVNVFGQHCGVTDNSSGAVVINKDNSVDGSSVGAAIASIATQIGTAGDGLTGIPWNSAWDAEVQSEAADALVAYDPPTKAELDTAVSTIRGADSDTLKTISDQVDGLSTPSAPQLLQSTTIASLSSQTVFALTAGSADDDAYNGAMAVITDQSTSTQKAFAVITDYVGTSKTITLGSTPVFTIAIGDSISVIAAASDVPTAAAIRAEIDANSTQLAAIVADTNELQADWANGGRLDVILDARASQSSVDTINGIVDAILIDTAEIGAAGAGLTAIASVTGKLDTAMELDGSVYRFTANALEQVSTSAQSIRDAMKLAPSGGSPATGSIDNLIEIMDGVVDAVKLVTDKVDTGLEDDGASGYQWTTLSLANGPTGSGASAESIADAVWDEAASGHVTAGTFGKAVADILADTAELQGDWTDGGRLDLILDGIIEDTGTTIPAAIATVDAVADAILVDTDELQGDITDGGRTDLLIDSIITATTAIAATNATIASAVVGTQASTVAQRWTEGVINIVRGDDYDGTAQPKITRDFTDTDKDLSTWTATMTWRKHGSSEADTPTFTETITPEDLGSDVYRFAFSPVNANTSGMVPINNGYYYDLQAKAPTGERYTLETGIINVKRDATLT